MLTLRYVYIRHALKYIGHNPYVSALMSWKPCVWKTNEYFTFNLCLIYIWRMCNMCWCIWIEKIYCWRWRNRLNVFRALVTILRLNVEHFPAGNKSHLHSAYAQYVVDMLHTKSSFPKRDKHHSQKQACNANANS